MKSRSVRLLQPLVASCVVLAVGCAPSPARVPQRHDIEIRAMRFVPDTVLAAVGDTLRWSNHDLVPHTASADSGAFDSGAIAPDSAWSVVLTRSATIAYACRFHPTMRARCEVRP